MNASDKLNEITKQKRSQARKDRIAFLRDHDPKASFKLYGCGRRIDLREWVNSGETKVIGAVLCGQKFLCEVCAVRRQASLHARAIPKIKTLVAEVPDLKPVLVTLTTKTQPDLVERFDHQARAWSAMRMDVNRARQSSKRKMPEFGKVLAFIRGIEIKRGDGDETHWNCHSHALCFIRDWIDQPKLKADWFRYTGDSMIVDVRQVHPKEGDEESDPLIAGLCEVLKYPLKFLDLRPCDALEAHRRLKGRRLTDSGGWLYGLHPGDIHQDEGIAEMTGPYRDFVASWIADQERFDLRELPQSLPDSNDEIPY